MFNLTKQERQVVLFLIIAALAGSGINYLVKKYSSVKVVAYFNQDISRVNLNRADKEALMGAWGIGEKLAGRIIEYRKKQGSFRDIEELKNIKGISGSKYEAIKEYFYLE